MISPAELPECPAAPLDPSRRRLRSVAARCAVLPILMAMTGAVSAAEYCVGSVTQLRDALDDAEVDFEDSLIKVRSGAYTLTSDVGYLPAAEFTVPAGKLTVRGGYNSDCSDYSNSSGATRFIASGNQRLSFRTQTGNVTLVGLSFEGAHLTLTSVVLGQCLDNAPNFNLRRIRSVGAGVRIVSQCHDVIIENGLFVDAVAVPDAGVPAGSAIDISLTDDDGRIGKLWMINNTVVNGALTLSGCCGQRPVAELYNNIFSRSGTEVFADNIVVLARHNRFDPISFTNDGALSGSSGNNTAAAANLDANFVPTAGSAMLDSGTADVPDGLSTLDQTGGDRTIGPGVDRGARESLLDGSGVYVVTNTSASGTGSLPWAIESANAQAGAGTVRFDITGGCPRIITLPGPLQVRETVLIDGWTQPGSVRNSEELGWNGAPCVLLRGPGAGLGIEAMGDIGTGSITARGLAFEGYEVAIALAFGVNHGIFGNQFGGRVGSSAFVLQGNGQAITLIGGGRTQIGAQTPESRNLIGSSSDAGIVITTFLGLGGADNDILNNLIGLDKNGASALPNGTGIKVSGGNNLIRGNRIGGNTVDGILISGDRAVGNLVIENYIGGGISVPSLVFGNGRMGVMVQSGARDNRIGPANIIGNNGDDGIRIFTSAGGHNKVTGNRVASNDALGIDIGPNGVDDNDLDPSFCDPETGCAANRGQNRPIVSSAIRRTTGVIPVDQPIRIEGTLRSVVGGPYRIEIYAGNACDANGFGEGTTFLGAFNMTIPNEPYCPEGGGFCVACTSLNCTKDFALWVPELNVDVGDVITAIATSPDGDSSEFSECAAVQLEAGPDALFKSGFETVIVPVR